MSYIQAAFKKCKYGGCCSPRIKGCDYCEQHKDTKPPIYNKRNRFYRKSPEERGYDDRWRQLSLRYRAQYPLCAFCLNNKRYVPAQVVDHIIPICVDGSKRLDWNNLQSLCYKCHNAKDDPV